MKRFSAQFKKQSEPLRMRASERAALKERLVSYMEYHPLPKEMAGKLAPSRAKKETIVSEPFFALTFNKVYVRSFAGIFAIVFIMGIPAVAERAVPGDILYPVKVEFNEELRSTLSLSPYAKVEWETERLERRISEARLLASEGKLTDEAEAQVAEAVQSHTDAAQREIAMLRESDSDEAAIAEIAFVSALQVQSEVLEGHMQKDVDTNTETTDNTGRSVVALAGVIAKARSSAEAAQANGTQLSYDKLLATVEGESTRIYELFSSVKADASEKEIKDVERRLADIQGKVTHAVALKEGTALQIEVSSTSEEEAEVLTATSTATNTVAVDEEAVAEVEIPEDSTEAQAEAMVLLKGALTDIQKLLNYLTHIDVRENVSIEDLVPVIPTKEEKALKVQETIVTIQAVQSEVALRQISPKLESKISHMQREIERKISLAVAALKKENHDDALRYAQDAQAFANDLVTLTADEPLKIPVVVDVEQGTSTEEVVEYKKPA